MVVKRIQELVVVTITTTNNNERPLWKKRRRRNQACGSLESTKPLAVDRFLGHGEAVKEGTEEGLV